MKCHICKKQREFLKYASGKLACRSCSAYEEFKNILSFYKYPSWLVWVTYKLGNLTASKPEDTQKRIQEINQSFEARKNIPFLAKTMLNYKWYFKNGGNVSLARVDELKRRRMAPDGNGEVVLRDKFMGRITDRVAQNY